MIAKIRVDNIDLKYVFRKKFFSLDHINVIAEYMTDDENNILKCSQILSLTGEIMLVITFGKVEYVKCIKQHIKNIIIELMNSFFIKSLLL